MKRSIHLSLDCRNCSNNRFDSKKQRKLLLSKAVSRKLLFRQGGRSNNKCISSEIRVIQGKVTRRSSIFRIATTSIIHAILLLQSFWHRRVRKQIYKSSHSYFTLGTMPQPVWLERIGDLGTIENPKRAYLMIHIGSIKQTTTCYNNAWKINVVLSISLFLVPDLDIRWRNAQGTLCKKRCTLCKKET